MRKHALVLLALFSPLVEAQLPPMGGAKRIQERARDLRDQSRQGQPPPPPPPRANSSPSGSVAPAYPTAAKSTQPAVHKAASAGDLQQLKELETQGNSLTSADADQSTPLHLAAYRGNLDVVDYLLSRPGLLKDPVDKRGITPLMLAAGGGHTAVVQSLLTAGCDAKLKAADGGSALHRAAAQGHAPVVELLLQAGSDPNQKDGNGKTPADLAAAKKKGEWETVVSRLKQTEP
jgi:ankyrin repeat protein